MPKAKKLPSGNWRVQLFVGYDENQKRVYKSFTSEDKKKAEYEAAEYAINRKKENSSENLSFKKALDRYIENKSNLLSPSTIRGYRIMQRNSFPLLINEPLGKLAANDLIQKQMNENARSYSAKSISNQYGLISAVMNYHNFRLDRVTLKPKEEKLLPVPTKKDAEKIMAILQEDPEIECQALLALTCSLRQSEIAALTVDDIKGRVVKVHGAKVPDENNKYIYKDTNKSKAGTRETVMPEYLSNKMNEKCKIIKDGLIFSMVPSTVLKRFKKLLKYHNMPPYTIHSLRHCFAAVMHAQGVPDKYVMEMGGWSSDNVLKRVYQYTFEDETNKAKEKANQYFDKIMQHEMQHKDK